MELKRFSTLNEEDVPAKPVEQIPYKVKIERSGASAGIQIRFTQDGVPLWQIMEAINGIRDKSAVEKAFAANDIAAMCKIGMRYHMLGNISKKSYDAYLALKERQKGKEVVETTED